MISKREQKRRLAYLRTLNREELMQAYYARMEQKASESNTLEYGRNIFASCKGRRQPKKARNTICKEQNGTCPQVVYGIRTSTHNVVVCKGWNNRF